MSLDSTIGFLRATYYDEGLRERLIACRSDWLAGLDLASQFGFEVSQDDLSRLLGELGLEWEDVDDWRMLLDDLADLLDDDPFSLDAPI
ncbi:MAG: Nif11 family protein [Chloroflexi bacterium]|nr:Nif11 family protein [Chloroflexota bacterium]